MPKATLSELFPTKAELFEATVLAAGGSPAPEPVEIPAGDLSAGLVMGFGTLPVLQAPGGYRREAHSAGSADIDDPELASAQFLGMIVCATKRPERSPRASQHPDVIIRVRGSAQP
ncbi:hypothetical protein ABT158_48190 [Nonomuraea sp. NPDC001636]|uniref:hypothetical protein n=1 Tax=Nonomuraea sp. NPDC001636 TaxID=3154391 RepID=UPI003317AE35